ncbi:toll/interleukin-1 receptor domain-containing protein [Terricaulis sp.]|uniref:toll/interleukin-1 receptor domain-containing protein n=1 Tax=Terricaulis sp. TaxID=2768686 RepID=UPI0037835280
MAEVFLSYSREDRARAEQVARGLEAAGVDVFWDNEIPPGTTWADYIEQKLGQCKALIVLWSQHSTKSQWVREEARMGRDKGVLIPAMIDNSQPPFGFGEVQAANLANWSGDANDPDWRRFVGAITSVAQAGPRPPAQSMSTPPRAHAPPPPQPQAAWQTQTPAAAKKGGVPVWVWVVGAIVGTVAVLGVIGSMLPEQGQQQTVATDTASTLADQSQQQQTSAEGAVLMQQLQQAEAAFAQQGYQPVGQPVSGLLPNAQAWNTNVSLVAGYDYRLIGVCDQNCGDLDLALYDQSGAVVAQDQSADAHPVVGGVPSYTGNFTIQAHMFQCNAPQGCYYALALYGRPAQ